MSPLQNAYEKRLSLKSLLGADCYRVFHGPTETPNDDLSNFAIDRFGQHAWITHWGALDQHAPALKEISTFVADKFESSVIIHRPLKGIPEPSRVFHGSPPPSLTVHEKIGHYLIQLPETRHPGLFLDHRPLRTWLTQQDLSQKRVLNGFAYTGSLSVAAALGGAEAITTVDLSKPSLEWAKENFLLNSIDPQQHAFYAADYFDFLKRCKKKQTQFDLIVADPPSFSRSGSSVFSTQKDLERLFIESAHCLSPNGTLIISINSAKITRKEFEERTHTALKGKFKILFRIHPSEDFSVGLQSSESDYLKGLALHLTQ